MDDRGSPVGSARSRVFPVTLAVLVIVWTVAMTMAGAWALYQTRWPMALTMAFGSFVAGSTPAGGGAVAYPVFTKALAIPSQDAALFGLMIQTVGMNMAALFIVMRGIRINLRVLRWTILGSIPGVMAGLMWLSLPANVPKLVFSSMLLVFAITLYRSHWRRRHQPEREIEGWTVQDGIRFAAVGLVGGLAASQLGSGADMLCFMVMTLGFGLDERIAVPTSVVVMAATSAAGFAFRMLQPEPVGVVWEYWAVAAPVVAFGAPFGAWVASRVKGGVILVGVFVLIVVEVTTTVILVPIDPPRAAMLVGVLAAAALWFRRLRRMRERRWAFSHPG
jgi:uncharacterized membrane protein YfcA